MQKFALIDGVMAVAMGVSAFRRSRHSRLLPALSLAQNHMS